YFVIIAIRNDRGEEVTRQVVNVGALQPAEKRTFTLSVEVLPLQAPAAAKSTSSTGSFKSPISQPTATVRPSTPPPTSNATPTHSPPPKASPTTPGGPQSPAPKPSPTGSTTPAAGSQQGSGSQQPAGKPAAGAAAPGSNNPNTAAPATKPT